MSCDPPPLSTNTSWPTYENAGDTNTDNTDATIARVFLWLRLCLAVIGVIPNIVAGVVLTERKLWSPTSMLLLSLVAYDAIFLLASIPVSVVGMVVPEDDCRYFDMFSKTMGVCYPIRYMAQTGAIYTTVTVTLERSIIVLRPLKARGWCTPGKTRKAIIAIFIFSIIFNIPRCFFYHLMVYPIKMANITIGCDVEDNHNQSFELQMCSESWNGRNELGVSGESSLDFLQSALTESSFPSTTSALSTFSSLTTPPSSNVFLLSSLPPLLLQESTSSIATTKSPPPSPSSSMSSSPSSEDRFMLYVWLYQVVYELYVSGIFFYLLPYCLIPILNLRLLVAIKHRRDETRRLSGKCRQQNRWQSIRRSRKTKPTDLEDGLTLIVIGITVSFCLCCLLPALYIVIKLVQIQAEAGQPENSTFSAFEARQNRSAPPAETTPLTAHLFTAGDTALCFNASTDFLFYCLLGRRFRRSFVRLLCPAKLRRGENASPSRDKSFGSNL